MSEYELWSVATETNVSRISTFCTKGARKWESTCKYSPIGTLFHIHLSAMMLMDFDRNAISGGNTIGPLICGFVVQSLGWRWHKWIAVIFTGM